MLSWCFFEGTFFFFESQGWFGRAETYTYAAAWKTSKMEKKNVPFFLHGEGSSTKTMASRMSPSISVTFSAISCLEPVNT